MVYRIDTHTKHTNEEFRATVRFIAVPAARPSDILEFIIKVFV